MALRETVWATRLLTLCQIATKAIPGLFNNFTKFLMLYIKKSKYMLVKLVQLKQDTENTIVQCNTGRLFCKHAIAAFQFR